MLLLAWAKLTFQPLHWRWAWGSHRWIVASAPMMVGGILQLGFSVGHCQSSSYKNWIIITRPRVAELELDSACIAACAGSLSPAALLVIASIYWAGGLAAGPAWNTWIGHLVPTGVRSRFFAQTYRGYANYSRSAVFCSRWVAASGRH